MELTSRLADVRATIAACGRDPASVRIVAVTKGHGPEAARAAVAAGLVDVGENYAAELVTKASEVEGARWHFLGSVQRNKVARLAPVVSVWHGIDRFEEGDAVAKRRPGASVFVEVGWGGDPLRGGCPQAEVAPLVERLQTLDLDVAGLMTVAPPGPPDTARRAFAWVAAEARRLGLRDTSMGMTNDFEVAVQEGATVVRLGTCLFGPRPGDPKMRR